MARATTPGRGLVGPTIAAIIAFFNSCRAGRVADGKARLEGNADRTYKCAPAGAPGRVAAGNRMGQPFAGRLRLSPCLGSRRLYRLHARRIFSEGHLAARAKGPAIRC